MAGNVKSVLESSGPAAEESPAGPVEITENQLALILAGKRRVIRAYWPSAPSVSIGMRVLGRQEMSESFAQAHMDAEALGNGKAFPGVSERMFRDHVIQKALCVWPPPKDGSEPDYLFSSVEDLRVKVMETDVEALWDEYARVEKMMAPLQHAEFNGQEQVFADLIESLGKEPGSPILKLLPRESLEILVVRLVSQMDGPSPRTNSSSSST